MFFVKERARIVADELSRNCKRGGGKITGIQYREGLYHTPEEAAAGAFTDFPDTATWAGDTDAHAWFTATFTIPADMDGRRLVFEFATQENGWDAVNPQFLLFIDGEVRQGLDTNHRAVVIADRAEAGRTVRIDLQAYSGQYKKLFFRARYYALDTAVYGLLMDIDTAVDVLEKLDKNDPRYYKLEQALTETLNRIDLRDTDSNAFYDSVRCASAYINEHVYSGGSAPVTVAAVGHTHIDVAWWWTVAQTREKTARSFATEVKLLEEYEAEGFTFMSSQPQLYRFVKDRYPRLYDRIKEWVAKGRWEAEGGMWVEADCNLTSGESLVRQFLHGKNFFKKEFGVDNVILWLPDVFGYSAALPQIMKKCGIRYFMTTKIAWNQFNKFPYDTFMWRGIDGTEILTHLITTTSPYQNLEKEFNTTYNGSLHPGAVIGAWNRYQQKALNQDVLISYGHGDGGGGVTREMIEQGIRLNKGIDGAPRVRFDTARNFFDALSERVAARKDLPNWAGELYLEYHRGTYTSMARNKRANRKLEFLLGELEFIALWAEEMGVPYPQADLLSMWETVLCNQFHDILPGSSIKEVYDVTKAEYDAIAEKAERLIQERLLVAPAPEGGVTALNTLHFTRDDVFIFNAADGGASAEAASNTDNGAPANTGVRAYTDGTRVYPAQPTHDGRLVLFAQGVPAKGFKPFIKTDAALKIENPLVTSERAVQTPYLSVTFDENGFITSVYDKAEQREVLKPGGLGNKLVVYEDKPMNYDNWDIDIYYTEKSWVCAEATEISWIEEGPVRAALMIKRPFHHSLLTQIIYFYADLKRIDFETHVDWKERQCLLKTEFDVDVNANEATYDIQFGYVKRPTHHNTSWDFARFEVCGHKFADVSEGGYGVALLNDCKYGHAIRDGKMTLSLIKSGIVPNPDADKEEHFFTYAFMPHAGDFAVSDVNKQAYALNVPLRAVTGGETGTAPASVAPAGFVSYDCDHVALETLKKSYDGERRILRLFEHKNKRGPVTLQFHRPLAAAYETDMMEERVQAVPLSGQTLTFDIKPFEIKTFEIQFEGDTV